MRPGVAARIVRRTMVVAMPGSRLSAGRVGLEHADLHWRWLPASDLSRLGRNLEVPAVRDHLRPFDRATVHERLLVLAHGDEWRGASLTLVVERDGEPLGLAGVTLHEDALRTRTYLHPDLHGSGANAAAKHVQWSVAWLTGLPLTAVVNERNARSQAAMARCWPGVRPTSGPASDRPGRSWLYELASPPCVGTPLDDAALAALRRLLEVTPFGGLLTPVVTAATAGA